MDASTPTMIADFESATACDKTSFLRADKQLRDQLSGIRPRTTPFSLSKDHLTISTARIFDAHYLPHLSMAFSERHLFLHRVMMAFDEHHMPRLTLEFDADHLGRVTMALDEHHLLPL